MKKLALVLAFLLCASPLWAAPTLVDVCQNDTTGGTDNITTTNCTVSGSNTYIACFAGRARSTGSITSLVWDAAGANEALTEITNTLITQSTRALGVWYGLKNPTAGTNKSVTLTGSGWAGAGLSLHCQSFSDVDQTTPVSGGATQAGGSGTTRSITVTSASGDLVVAGLLVNDVNGATSLTAGADETAQTGPTKTARATADENIWTMTLTQAGAASVSVDPTWTTSSPSVLSGFSLKAAAAAAARVIAPIIIQ